LRLFRVASVLPEDFLSLKANSGTPCAFARLDLL
jgi:hypothetical protein